MIFKGVSRFAPVPIFINNVFFIFHFRVAIQALQFECRPENQVSYKYQTRADETDSDKHSSFLQ